MSFTKDILSTSSKSNLKTVFFFYLHRRHKQYLQQLVYLFVLFVILQRKLRLHIHREYWKKTQTDCTLQISTHYTAYSIPVNHQETYILLKRIDKSWFGSLCSGSNQNECNSVTYKVVYLSICIKALDGNDSAWYI